MKVLLLCGVCAAASFGAYWLLRGDGTPAQADESVPAVATDSERAEAEATNRIGLEWYQRAAAGARPGETILICPHALRASIGLVYALAEGDPADRLAKAMGFDADPERFHAEIARFDRGLKNPPGGQANRLTVATSIWASRPEAFAEPVRTAIHRQYPAAIQYADFQDPRAASRTMNQWAANRMFQPPVSIVHPDHLRKPEAKVVAFTASFRAEFFETFNPTRVVRSTFRMGGKEFEVPTAVASGRFRYGVFDGVQIVEVPLRDPAQTLFLLLPPAQAAVDFGRWTAPDLEARFDQLAVTDLYLRIPEIERDDEFETDRMVDAMGLPCRELGVAHVLSSTRLRIGQQWTAEGLRAAAGRGMLRREPGQEEMIVNRPFLIVIRDQRTGAFLYIGRLTRPRV